jgi:multiphosphoryl transfer protein
MKEGENLADLVIVAPVHGWAAPLEEVPDAVFSDRLMGDGLAIHPLGSTIHAPCDGEIINLHAAGHAVTIRSPEGAELLIHFGLETVALGGEGFRPLVSEGDRVSRTDPLIEVDLDMVGMKAKSLVTPVILTNSEAFTIERRTVGQMVALGEMLMTARAIEVEDRIWTDVGTEVFRRTITIPLVHGIHARPAARIGECARAFQAEVAFIHGDKRAATRSAVGLMGLGAKMGDTVTLEARGLDGRAALSAVAELIASGLGELPPARHAPPPPVQVNIPEGALQGVSASPGLAVGTVAWLTADETLAVPEHADDPDAEIAALEIALSSVASDLASRATGNDDQRHIFEAHQAMLSDADLMTSAKAEIAKGRSAGMAWSRATAGQAAILMETGNSRIAGRVADLDDIERQVLNALYGAESATQSFAPDTVLFARDLLPSQLVALDLSQVRAIVLAEGGPTSHVAILSASMNIPALAAMGEQITAVSDGETVIIDADAGLLFRDCNDDRIAHYRAKIEEREERRITARAASQTDCHSADGTRIEVFANLASLDDAKRAVEMGAEGSGLLRTEFLFMERTAAPDEDEQFQTYQAIASAMEGRPVIIRLLDIGGDKPAPYLDLGAEKNPVLGQRGIRVSLARLDLLEAQLRAILRVQPVGQCRIMVPMLSSLSELRAVRTVMDKAQTDLGVTENVELGVMIETPAAAATADLIAAEADFLSVGTNDLTQYVLAMDRENPAVASGIDAMHPAVLRLIGQTCAGAARYGRPVGVCGGLASDPVGIPLLIGLGVTELSATPAFVPDAKAIVRRLDVERCRELAAKALDMPAPGDIRRFVRVSIEDLH